MRAESLLLTAPRRLAWIAATLPPPGPGEALVETRNGAISVGSELPVVRGDERSATPAFYPRMTGYENVAVVRAVGAGVGDIGAGDRVVTTYGHRTRAVVPAERLVRVPAGVPDPAALLAILSGDVATGIAKLGAAGRGAVLVTGAGAIGLLATAVLRARGATGIDVVEPRPERRALALALGADAAFAPDDPTRRPGDAERYDAGVECSSRDAAFALLQDRVRPGGTICVLADGNLEPLTLTPRFHANQLRVVGSSDCPDYHAHARWWFPLARDRAADLDRLFDLRIDRGGLPETFAALAEGAVTPVKVLVSYGATGQTAPSATGPGSRSYVEQRRPRPVRN